MAETKTDQAGLASAGSSSSRPPSACSPSRATTAPRSATSATSWGSARASSTGTSSPRTPSSRSCSQDLLARAAARPAAGDREADDPVDRIEQGIRASIGFFREDPGFLAVIRTAARYDEFAGASSRRARRSSSPTPRSTSRRACRREHPARRPRADGARHPRRDLPLRRDLPRDRTARLRTTVRSWPTRPSPSASAGLLA